MSADLLCGHWTFFGAGEETARCDLDAGHVGMHRHWWSPETHESFSWSDAFERHTRRELAAVGGPEGEQ